MCGDISRGDTSNRGRSVRKLNAGRILVHTLKQLFEDNRLYNKKHKGIEPGQVALPGQCQEGLGDEGPWWLMEGQTLSALPVL